MRAREFDQAVIESIDPYGLERLDPQTRRALMRMADHAEPGSWLSASEAYAMQLGLRYKNRDPQGWEQGVQHLVDTYRQYATVLEGDESLSEIDRRGFLRGLGAAALAGVGGQALARAPAKYEYVKVQPGDTVYSIARAFSTTPQEIQRLNRLGPDFQISVNQELRIPVPRNVRTIEPQKQKPQPQAQAKPAAQPGKKTKSIPTLTGTRAEEIAKQTALNAGIRGVELAAFLSQVKHETTDFTSMFERGSKNYFQRMYDIAYRPAKATELGNDKVGDGVRYRGRGFIQLTGRDNYRRAGRRLGLDLENNPDLAARPDVAARIAVLYWKQRVRPNVKDWTNVRQVTLPINGGLNGLEDRQQNFRQYMRFYGLGGRV